MTARAQMPPFARYCPKRSSDMFFGMHQRLLDARVVPTSKVAQHLYFVAWCEINQCPKGAVGRYIDEEATLNRNFTDKLLYIAAGNRQNYTRRCTPPFFLQRGCIQRRCKRANNHWPFLRSIMGRNAYTLASVQSSLRARCVVVREMNSSLLGRICGSEAMP